MKTIGILGSTGSIGRNTLKVVKNLNKNGFPITVGYLSANSNTELLSKQIEEFKPKTAIIFDKSGYEKLKDRCRRQGCEILFGSEGVKEVINRKDYNLVVNALVGFSGLEPTIEAVKNGVDIALANKESLVVAGELISELVKDSKSKILPVDSEHNAIFQCIQGEQFSKITKLILTASGGPFLNYSKELFENISQKEALNHPNWKMGNKITIDSATLMNKGFEIIEARWLFNINVESIEVIIHPQSIIHSMVEFADGSVKAQLGIPDMKIPIQYALTYPDRIASEYPRLDFKMLNNLTFIEPDLGKFECLKLAYEVIKQGGAYPVVLNASNEVTVDLFLKKKIKFSDIPHLIRAALESFKNDIELSLENIFEIDRWSRDFVNKSVLAIN
ncbi:MAG: 1-deoxy-D-xylulose-5-phosphate reductoisomerase [Ignavibacteria bacterium]